MERRGPGRCLAAPSDGATSAVMLLMVAAAVVLGSVVVALATASSVRAAPVAADDGLGGIEGTVTHGGDGTPIAHQAVVLLRAEQGEEEPVATVTTDAGGTFAFPEVAPGTGYEVRVDHAGAPYRSGALEVRADEVVAVDLEVYDSTTSPEDVTIASWVLWVDRADGVTLQHDLHVENRGERTYLGVEPDAAGERAVISVPLPPGATGLRFLGRFTECCATMRGTEYVHTTPLTPGSTVGTVRASVTSLDRLDLPVRLPVEAFTMMVPTGVSVRGGQVEHAGQIDSQGNTYDVYTAADLATGEVLEIGLSGLMVASTPLWQPVAAAIAALLVGAGGAVWFGRRQRSRGAARGAAQPAVREAPSTARPAPSTPVAPRADGAPVPVDAAALVEELALLDLGFERGLISREVYEPLRAARRSELERRLAAAGR